MKSSGRHDEPLSGRLTCRGDEPRHEHAASLMFHERFLVTQEELFAYTGFEFVADIAMSWKNLLVKYAHFGVDCWALELLFDLLTHLIDGGLQVDPNVSCWLIHSRVFPAFDALDDGGLVDLVVAQLLPVVLNDARRRCGPRATTCRQATTCSIVDPARIGLVA